MLKQIFSVLYRYVDVIEPVLLLLAAVLYLVHFFFLDRRTKEPLLAAAFFIIAVSCALTLAIVLNRFVL